MTVVETSGLTKRFGNGLLAFDFEMSVRRGGMVPTTMRMLVAPCGHSIGRGPRAGGPGRSGQDRISGGSARLFPYLSGRDNLKVRVAEVGVDSPTPSGFRLIHLSSHERRAPNRDGVVRRRGGLDTPSARELDPEEMRRLLARYYSQRDRGRSRRHCRKVHRRRRDGRLRTPDGARRRSRQGGSSGSCDARSNPRRRAIDRAT